MGVLSTALIRWTAVAVLAAALAVAGGCRTDDNPGSPLPRDTAIGVTR